MNDEALEAALYASRRNEALTIDGSGTLALGPACIAN